MSEFTLFKRAIFAAIRPQFDDDLHSSRCRSERGVHMAHLISSDLISSELGELRLVATTANWVAPQRTSQFVVATTNHSGAPISNEVRSDEMSHII